VPEMLYILRSIAELLIHFKPIRRYSIKCVLEESLQIAAIHHVRNRESDRALANEIEEKAKKISEVSIMFAFGLYNREPADALTVVKDEIKYFQSLDAECRN
jgi:hypothetical protein